MNISIPTTDELRAAIRCELASFFASNNFQPQPETDEIGGIDLAVEVTGKAKATVYSLCSQRKIPHKKQGKQLYFSKKELLEWINSGSRRTAAEIQNAVN